MKYRIRAICAAALLAAMMILSAGAFLSGCGKAEQPAAGDISVGEHIFFGSYPQSDEEPEPIEWRVLDIKDGKALLISEKLLDKGGYNDRHEKITWEKCSLREWLNNEFLEKAFTPEEAARIAVVKNSNPNNPVLFTDGGRKTEDRVFLLSINEAKKYFKDDRDRAAVPTFCAAGFREDAGDVIWWLRSPGGIGNHAAYVREDGTINRMGYTIGGSIYIRPALWIEI